MNQRLLAAFVILRVVATACYLLLKSQELHEALKEVHEIIGEEADERVRLREQGPAIEANVQTVVLLTDQLAAMSNQHQKARLLPLSMLSAPGLPSGMPASSEVRSDWSSRISLGPATTSP